MKPLYPLGTKRYVIFRREVIELTYDYNYKPEPEDDGAPPLWRDERGGVWAFPEKAASVDDDDGAGVGIFKWRSWFPWAKKLNRAAKVHDWMYSCPAWQYFHTRKESDSYLKYLIKVGARGDGSQHLAQTFKQLSREFGENFWENERTNN